MILKKMLIQNHKIQGKLFTNVTNNVTIEFPMSYNLILKVLQVIMRQLDQMLCFR